MMNSSGSYVQENSCTVRIRVIRVLRIIFRIFSRFHCIPFEPAAANIHIFLFAGDDNLTGSETVSDPEN
jgi:hypothetical protein